MTVQLPAGAGSVAAGVFIWSIVCLMCNFLMLWLLWTSGEKRSFISVISVVALIVTTTTTVQVVLDTIYYEDIMTSRLAHVKAHLSDPLLAASNCAQGADLVFESTRYASYIALAGLGFFWVFSLTQAVYLQSPLTYINKVGKFIPIAVGVLTMCLMHSEALRQAGYLWYFFVADICYILFCLAGITMLLAILLEYIQTRLLLARMTAQQRQEFDQQSMDTCSNLKPLSFGALQQAPSNIHDKWLVARFSIPFLALCMFEIYNILAQIRAHHNIMNAAKLDEPDLSAAWARSYMTEFVPGSLPSILTLLSFGTTKQFREKLYRTFMPACFKNGSSQHQYQNSLDEFGLPQRSPMLNLGGIFAGMDGDAGKLSRKKRLSMTRRMEISVVTEIEVRMESLDVEGRPKSSVADVGNNGSVESNSWEFRPACQPTIAAGRCEAMEQTTEKPSSL